MAEADVVLGGAGGDEAFTLESANELVHIVPCRHGILLGRRREHTAFPDAHMVVVIQAARETELLAHPPTLADRIVSVTQGGNGLLERIQGVNG